jgi:hypothetical protein
LDADDLARRKQARKQNWDDATFDHEGNFSIEYTAEDREERPTQFEAPKDRKWKARNLVTIHWNILNYPCPYPSMVHIFACVIDHANINNGRCDASQKVMAIETGYSVKTVRKVLDWLAVNTPFLEIERRVGIKGQFRSNAYHVQWQHLEVDYIALQVCIEEAKDAHRASKHSTIGTQGGSWKGKSRVSMDRGNSRGDTNHEHNNHEGEPRHEVVRPPSVDDTNVIISSEGKEGGIQEGEVESASTNSHLPEGPTEGEIQTVVSGYCEPFHWAHLTEEDFDAAVVAELRESGAGRAVIMQRVKERGAM